MNTNTSTNTKEPKSHDLQKTAEAQAIRRACDGDSDAWERLYTSHSRRVYGLCLRISGNPAEAEDLTQEAFLQAFRKIQTFRGESTFSTWLYRLTVNIALMKLRRKKHPEISIDATADDGETETKALADLGAPDLRLNGVLDRVNLDKAIEQLPQGYKEIFLLHDVQGYEHNEIAGLLGCSIGNSKSQLFKARMRLRKLLQEALRSRARDTRMHAHTQLACAAH